MSVPAKRYTLFSPSSRRGAITLWLILVMPILVILLCVVADLGKMWLARVELENALEASALAAVKQWGDAEGGPTWKPRQVGAVFAAANTVQGEALELGLNYDESKRPNENANCEGDLIFGAVISRDRPWVFDADVEPGCRVGRVLVDATGAGNLRSDNAWGVSFYAGASSNDSDLVIGRMVIDLDPWNQDIAHFEGSAVLSDNRPQPAVRDRQQNSQPDNFGWDGMPPYATQSSTTNRQIYFVFAKPSPACGNPRRLVIEFGASGDDAGFSPGDRFRFGAGVSVRNPNGSSFRRADGDDVGQIGAQVTVFMKSRGQSLPPVEGIMRDTGGRRRDCLDNNWETDSLGHQHLVVHPHRILDLPCPASSSVNSDKNGQSRTLLGGPHYPFAVRAQATVQISSLVCQFGGQFFGPYEVSACATAIYDCKSRRPKLIRVRRENFICR